VPFVCLLVLAVVAPGTEAAGAPAGPMISFEGEADGVRVVTTANPRRTFERFDDVEMWATIDGGTVAVTRHLKRRPFASNVILYDAATGERLDRIVDARYPLLFDGGTKVLFGPDNHGRLTDDDRDEHVNSVWYRDLEPGNEEVRLAQLGDPDLSVLHYGVDPDATKVAFTVGNDWFLFQWNIFVATLDRTEPLVQITTDDRSLYPSFSPDGQTIAFTYVDPTAEGCGQSVHLMDADGKNARSLFEGTCEYSLSRPVWLDDATLITMRWAQRADGAMRPTGLVTVSVTTGEVLEQVVTGPVRDFAVAREDGKVVFRLKDGAIGMLDVASGDISTVPGGKKTPGWHLHVEGSLELAY
jgi:hypothetical protein